MLALQNMAVRVGETQILKDITLQIRPGECHVIMGANGTGKSSLLRALIGDVSYEVTGGNVMLDQQSLLSMSIEERAKSGLFMSFQNPVAIPGVSNLQFIKAAVNARLQAHGQAAMDAIDMLLEIKQQASELEIDESFLYRSVNEGFSGGERKRNELLQMMLLKPRFALLDELDSGLDIDALKVITENISRLREKEGTGLLVVSHYYHWLESIKPSHVHILENGTIKRSGGIELARAINEHGFAGIAA
jgi:Fe-S cluster assembly ATP-binding protein